MAQVRRGMLEQTLISMVYWSSFFVAFADEDIFNGPVYLTQLLSF